MDSWAPMELKKMQLEMEQSLIDVIETRHVFEQFNKQSESMLPKVGEEVVNKITLKKRFPQSSEVECSRYKLQ